MTSVNLFESTKATEEAILALANFEVAIREGKCLVNFEFFPEFTIMYILDCEKNELARLIIKGTIDILSDVA